MNNWIARKIYYAAQMLRRENAYRALGELNNSQWFFPARMNEVRRQRLKSILEYSFENVPFYQKRLKGLNAVNADNFGEIPVLAREEVRNNLDLLISREFSRRRLLQYHSSGSTGEPLTLYFNPEAMGYFHAAQYRGFSWYDLEPVDRCVKLWGVPFKIMGRIQEGFKDFAMNRVRISAFEMSKAMMENYFKKCLRFKPVFLYGYASALAKFALFIRENNLDGRKLGLRAIICTSEVLYEHQRILMEAAFGCRVADEYGAAEVGIIAFQCPKGRMHITSENVHLEILNGGSPVNEGEQGEVVVTGLRNYAMPLIRYKLGDIAAYSNEICPCGRGLPIMKSIQGRDNDMVVSSDGGAIHSEVFAYINRDLIKEGFLIKEFKIIQRAQDVLDVFVLKGTQESAVVALKEQIHKHIGKGMRINIEYRDEIPREKSGKVRYFTSDVYRAH